MLAIYQRLATVRRLLRVETFLSQRSLSTMIDSTTRTTGSLRIQVRQLDPRHLHGQILKRWQTLLANSQSANTFLSPEFVLPYLEAFPRKQAPLLLTGEDRESGELVGLGVFEPTKGTRALPLPHLLPLHCHHQYRDGMLVSATRAVEFFDSLLKYLTEEQDEWFGIEFRQLLIDQPWALQLRQRAMNYGCSFRLTPRFASPAVHLTALEAAGLEAGWSSSRRKSYRRNRNRVEKLGAVRMRLLTQYADVLPGVERFLKLEHSGWKGAQGTSLLSTPRETEFARKMTRAHARAGNLIVSELWIGDEVAASALNFKAGNQLQAFKIGWNDRFADVSPGVLHEVELIRGLRETYPLLEWADSCANADSYLNGVWTDSQTVGEGLLSASKIARGTGKLMAKIRRLKQWTIRQLRSPEAP